jgi:ketosteroid isomerase-like protein
MSQENVELVMSLQRSGDEDFAQLIRDDERWRRLAAAAAPLVHADAVSVRPGIPGGKAYVGLEGFRQLWLDWLAPWAKYRTAVDEAFDCGERVLLLQSSLGRMEGTSREVKLSPGVIWTVRDRKIARFEVYADRAQALKAVGPEEQAMSQENVETVRRAIAAINARDIDAYLACCTQNVELLIAESVGAEYLGADGIRRFFTDIEDIGPDFLIEVQRVQAIGDSNALALLRVGSTGRASGIVTSAESGNVYDFVDGKISRIRIFLDRDEALKAVGLE